VNSGTSRATLRTLWGRSYRRRSPCNMNSRSLRVASTVCLLALATAACGSSSGGGGSSGGSQNFKVGITVPLTGPDAATGAEMKNAVTLALEKVNYKVGPYTIVPDWIDEASNPASAAAALEKAIVSDGIQAGFLNWNSSDAVAMMNVVARHKIPYFFGMGATGIVNQTFHSDQAKYGYWMAKGWAIPGDVAKVYADAVQAFVANGSLQLSHGKTVALWAEDTDWGHSLTDSVKQRFTELGWQVMDQQFFAIDATDQQGLLNRFKNEGVSVVAGTASAPQTASAFLKQAADAGLHATIIADGLGYIGNFYTLAGAASNGVLDMQPQFATSAAQAFVQTYKSRFGHDPSPSSAGVPYDWAGFFVKVLQRTVDKYGSLSSANVFNVGRDELWTGKLTYTNGIMMKDYRFSEQSIPDPVVGSDGFVLPVVQYSNGQPNVVYPPALKTADFKQP
jgi:branched-chain amino acid transport system substrate-binding protein